ALQYTDDMLGRVQRNLPPRTLLLVVSVVPPGQKWHLTPVVASGAGVVKGYLHSPSTERLGLVTLTDVAPTILDSLGVAVPDGVASVPVLFGIDAVIMAVAARARRHPLSPLAWVMGFTAVVLMVDVATGARLQVNSVLGYSPLTAARFFGIGNSAFAVLAATGLLAAAIHLQYAPRRREALVTVGAVLVLLIVVDGAPSLGGDVGGILTLVPVVGLALLAFTGRRISWRTVAALVAVTVVVFGAPLF